MNKIYFRHPITSAIIRTHNIYIIANLEEITSRKFQNYKKMEKWPKILSWPEKNIQFPERLQNITN
jgi:hypothetical protein